MKSRTCRHVLVNRIIVLFCICNLLLAYISPLSVRAASETEDYLNPAEIINLTVERVGEEQMISGTLSDMDFTAVGKFYRVYDNIDCDKIYFVESEPDYSGSIFILNMEFESSAALHNLNIENRNLEGKDVVRIAAYADGEFYYAEQQCVIPEAVIEAVIPLSMYTKSPAMERIISNCAWFSYVKPKTLTLNATVDETKNYSTNATPRLGDSLDATDIDVIENIKAEKFTSEIFVSDTTDTGGYMLFSSEWPYGTGNIFTYCIYYNLVMNTPTETTDKAVIEIELIANRQYLYDASTNTIEAYLKGTDYRMYDVKLALACVQTDSKCGYDYIYERTTSLSVDDEEDKTFKVAKAIIMQFDKYRILSVADEIFDAFSSNDVVSGQSTIYWPIDYSEHYKSIGHGKRANSMVRAVRIDTDGYLLNKEGATLNLTAFVVDRDYEDSTSNESMKKAIKYAFSYNLRSKNPVWLWIGGGDDRGIVTHEKDKKYTK